ncbi:MAG: tetratricopeptide repeat protein [Alphaproteobacteria bacterium]|nr:tetratricopeptide repeat protein [Alphaproteobacteria bacterium]
MLLIAVAMAGLVEFAAGKASAQGVAPDSDPAVVGAYDEAFKAMLADPATTDKMLRYAALAVRLGNYEAAVATLERLLLYVPKASEMRLQLATLYYRLGSFDTAETYLRRIIDDPETSAELRQTAERHRAEVQKRQSLHGFSGLVAAGMRYQTNATAGPGGDQISIGGARFDRNVFGNLFDRRDDYNGYVYAALRHDYDLDTGANEAWQSDITAYIWPAKSNVVNLTAASSNCDRDRVWPWPRKTRPASPSGPMGWRRCLPSTTPATITASVAASPYRRRSAPASPWRPVTRCCASCIASASTGRPPATWTASCTPPASARVLR